MSFILRQIPRDCKRIVANKGAVLYNESNEERVFSKGRIPLNKKTNMLDKVMGFINLAGTAVLMNLTFLLFCIPIVTIGQAWCGLLSAVRYNVRGEGWFKGFMIGFKRRFLRGTVLWIIGLALILLFIDNITRATGIVDTVAGIFMLVFAGVMLHSGLLLNVYIPTSVGNWIKNTVNMGLSAAVKLIVCAAIYWLPVLVFAFYDFWILYELALMFVFAFYALAALVTTILLKEDLTKVLLACREEGILTAEEGLAPVQEDEDE